MPWTYRDGKWTHSTGRFVQREKKRFFIYEPNGKKIPGYFKSVETAMIKIEKDHAANEQG